MELIHEELTKQIIGAFFAVHDELGHGFLESVYTRALAVELQLRGIECKREVLYTVIYKRVAVGYYKADLVVEGKVIVEVKALEKITAVHEVQLINYLAASRIPIGLVVNFAPKATFRRLVLTSGRRGAPIFPQ